jgi:hypothetical protein
LRPEIEDECDELVMGKGKSWCGRNISLLSAFFLSFFLSASRAFVKPDRNPKFYNDYLPPAGSDDYDEEEDIDSGGSGEGGTGGEEEDIDSGGSGEGGSGAVHDLWVQTARARTVFQEKVAPCAQLFMVGFGKKHSKHQFYNTHLSSFP